MTYDQLVLDERRAWPSQLADADAEAVARALYEAARARGTHAFVDDEALERLRGRVAFVRAHLPEAGLPELGDAELDATLRRALRGRDSFAELREARLPRRARGAARARRRRRCWPRRRPSG